MASRIFIDGSGNVGINTSSPGTTLDVSGSISQYSAAASNYNGYLKTNNSGQSNTTLLNPGILLFNQSGTYNYGMDMGSNPTAGGKYRTRVFAPDTADIAFSFAPSAGATSQSGFTDRVVITGNGNMGIGTVTPLAELNVQGDASGTYASDSGQIIISGSTNSNKRLGIALDTNNNVGILQAGLSGTTTYPIALNPGGSNVGINTTSPGTTLDVSGTARFTSSVTTGSIRVVDTNSTLTLRASQSNNIVSTLEMLQSNGTGSRFTYNGTTDLFLYEGLNSNVTNGSIICIQNTGSKNIGIGTTSPGTTLDVSGTFRATTSVTSGGLFATNVTATYIVGTTISAGTLVGTTITGSNLSLSGNISIGTLLSTNVTTTNIVGTTISAGTLVGTTITGGNLSLSGNISIGTLLSTNVTTTNIVGTTISAGTLVGTTITGSNLSLSGNISIGTLLSTNVTTTNIVGTTISAGTLVGTTITGGNLSLSGNISIGTILATTRVSAANLNTSVISAGTLIGTIITGGNLSLSGNISIGTLLATTRVSSTNLNSSSITTGIIYLTASGTNIAISPQNGAFGTIEAFTTGNTAKLPLALNPYGGNVGIGITSPGCALELQDSTINSNAPFIKLGNSNGGSGNQVGIKLSPYTGRSGGDSSQIIAVDDGAASSHLTFYTASGDAGTSTERMRITNSGNVGIGTDTPAIKLQVLGKVGIGETVLTDSLRGILDIKASAVDYHSTKLMSDYALTLSHQTVTNGSLGIAFGITGTSSVTPGASIIFERTASTNVGLLHFCTRSGSAGTSPNVIRMTVQTTGNVGIGTTAPTSTLQINGSLAKTSGTFDIKHPIVPDKRLVHSFIEGPRCDLIYRGKVTLQNGQATVNLDTDCVAERGSEMTQGTFEALCANPDYYLQNNSSFDRVKGSISGNILTIISENSASTDKISWMVVAERKDTSIKEWDRTNSSGYLITEY
jgi:hypothetical protein